MEVEVYGVIGESYFCHHRLPYRYLTGHLFFLDSPEKKEIMKRIDQHTELIEQIKIWKADSLKYNVCVRRMGLVETNAFLHIRIPASIFDSIENFTYQGRTYKVIKKIFNQDTRKAELVIDFITSVTFLSAKDKINFRREIEETANKEIRYAEKQIEKLKEMLNQFEHDVNTKRVRFKKFLKWFK
ncbi:hypothetical protein P8825_14205 [Shouchella clausii]|uniref:hypothetical protein n=1 Tax=Shouchella clausii TaxID=79880 RepID=UPI002DBBC296|nr:hypothetical protein [Shouchella clausii]MEB5480716.1 hypothetical protein [Shouchella clausii]